MHATHQFFLTKRSLYLLVLDSRLGEEENRLEYWLKIIDSFSKASPVLIVGNKCDQQPLDIDRKGLRKKYPNIMGFIETSCKNTEGIRSLKEVISQGIESLSHLRDELPISWFSVKEKLEKFPINEDYIPYSQYQSICQEEKITDENNQKTLLGFLHDLGVILNFQDDPRLADNNVLNPEWVTNGVYKILNDPILIRDQKGVLNCSDLNRILDPENYPSQKHMFIIDMMRKFELCFPIEADKKYLIPDILPKEEPDTGDWDNSLAFQYHYSVLPNSIISRFIVRMNHLISKNTYWRSGVVLISRDRNNRALIKADREEKIISIWITGDKNSRSSFLSIIRNDFQAIHKTISALETDEKVPIPEKPDVVVSYKNLLMHERKNLPEMLPAGMENTIKVKELLDLIESEAERRVNVNRIVEEDLIAKKTAPEPVPKPEKDSKNNLSEIIKAIAALIGSLTGLAAILTVYFTFINKPQPTPSPTQTATPSPPPSPSQTP